MFNEILTGKGSNEPEKQADGPYRGTELAMVDTRCAGCHEFFKQSAAGTATKCMSCQLAAAQASAGELPPEMRISRTNKDLFRAIAVGVLILIVAGIRYYIVKQRIEEEQRNATYFRY
ncbi:MAG TPA: hypothetical protein VGM90_03865 [Kofleriaceae bacterium]